MILDAQLQFSDAQAFSSSGASTNLVDFGVDRNIGIGEEMAVLLVLDAAADDGNSDETYVFDIQADSDSGFGSAVSVGSITVTRGAAAGSQYAFLLPKGTETDRYMRLNATLGGTSPSVTVTAFVTPAKSVDKADVYYASGYTVS